MPNMDQLLDAYKVELSNYIELSQLDTKTRTQLQQSRSRLAGIKNEMRAQEAELLEIK